MTYRVTRVRRDAIPAEVDFMLMGAKVGDRVHLTIWGVPSDAVITELSAEWAEFRTDPEETS